MADNNRPKAYKTGKIRQDNKAQILKAAEIEFASSGFDGASVNSIANRAGLPRTNVHYYFTSKLDLYVAVLTGVLELWNEAFNQITEYDDPADALGAYIRAKVMYSQSHPEASKIFASEILHGAPKLTRYLNKDFRTWFRNKARIIQAWIDQGKMDPVDPYHLIFLIWSSTQHYADFNAQVCAVLGKSHLSRRDYQKIADSLTTIILKGCGIALPGEQS